METLIELLRERERQLLLSTTRADLPGVWDVVDRAARQWDVLDRQARRWGSR